MSDQQYILEDSFWKFLVSLEDLKDRKKVTLFCLSLSIDENKFESYCQFLISFKIVVMKDQKYIYPLNEQCKIKMEFSLSEWLALQAAIPKENHVFYFQQIVQSKILRAQNAYAQFSLYKKPDNQIINGNIFEKIIKIIDNNIFSKKTLNIKFFAEKECKILPHRLVYLGGTFCIIGESILDKTLVYFGIEDIHDVETVETNTQYEPNLSQIEVNEFISHIRLINGQEERLVLKIYGQDENDLLPKYHFLGNPFVTCGAEGDLVWAATLEICDDVYNWLYKMRDKVEVLDPGHIRKEFSHYCEMKKALSDSKKAS